ncbi:hypothetical protein HD601_001613 [Jiangella mangrovi]|uniref:DUF7711 domain-containing protein n=1 Tax=Jiangella mangrovi TaxID=1524084 RepID=A0A7W9GNC0_9ACTN|nr:hypothetical protein [Jiangella mangrovi]MBB5787038.1 hypothetical protein [Jiangella mangrovi]
MLVAAYAFGQILEDAGDLDVVQVAIVLDLPAAQLTWGAQPAACRWLRYVLDLGRNPVSARWRPAAWPVWNHRIQRPLRLWSAADGIDSAALDALSRGKAESFRLPSPPHEERAEQYRLELTACRDHLRTVRDHYWDRDWRREHHGDGDYPDQQLWSATDGYLEMVDVVHSLAD